MKNERKKESPHLEYLSVQNRRSSRAPHSNSLVLVLRTKKQKYY
uniref:Uncharacterized protein n=1 Tax=Anguilla anguilla TaxID=7936 RepID=A0A0E9VEB7_ANGAN